MQLCLFNEHVWGRVASSPVKEFSFTEEPEDITMETVLCVCVCVGGRGGVLFSHLQTVSLLSPHQHVEAGPEVT